MRRSPRLLATVAAATGILAATASAAPERAIPEPGFAVTPFVETGGTPTSLAFGPSTLDDADPKVPYLYFTDGTAGGIGVVDPLGVVSTFATDLRTPLGVLVDDDGTVYVSDVEPAREGPYGFRSYGRVLRLRDTDGDGMADKRNVVLKDLPNGRHNTNGLAFGPDGKLYVTNGNSTDDGVEGGEAEVEPWSGSVVRVSPRAKNVSVTKLPRRALVAHGWRNIYDLAFSPLDETKLFVPMNGADDARQGSTAENPVDPDLEDSDDLLYLTDVDDTKIHDFAFPQCLYNLAERGNLKPYQNPNPDVIERFGKCRKKVVPRPVASFGLHPSANGLAFQTTDAWGGDYVNDLFVAEWGSLFGQPAGHKVVRIELTESGTKVESLTEFVEMDLPLDLTFHPDGSMYVADFSGTIFKIVRAL
ncbi:MAG: PQQ-dependent sugar dehydrogenase [Actinomycetota bacterium]|nr:PQQ-dependent sugar dehydrogenase [Actinomycetota bacterium]